MQRSGIREASQGKTIPDTIAFHPGCARSRIPLHFIRAALAMTFQYPKRLAYLLFIAASVFEILLFVDDKSRSMQPIAWLIVEPLPICMILFGIYTFKYKCLIDDNSIIVTAFKQSQYPLADITSIEVVIGRGASYAVVKLKDGRRVSFPNYMDGFNNIVELLRHKTGLAKPRWKE